MACAYSLLLSLFFLFRAPAHIGRAGLPWDVRLPLGDLFKGCRFSLRLKEPTAAAVLTRTLLSCRTPVLRGLGAEPRRRAVLVAPLILARWLTFHYFRFLLGRGLLGRNRRKR